MRTTNTKLKRPLGHSPHVRLYGQAGTVAMMKSRTKTIKTALSDMTEPY
jgi:hypothetical protein